MKKLLLLLFAFTHGVLRRLRQGSGKWQKSFTRILKLFQHIQSYTVLFHFCTLLANRNICEDSLGKGNRRKK